MIGRGNRPPFVVCWILFAGVAVGSLSGCSQGESIPVMPVHSTLDAAPDPFFRALAPLCGERLQKDAVQWSGGRACIVGTRGLVMVRGSDERWLVENPGVATDLVAVSALPDGTVLAIGAHGTILERKANRWTRVSTGIETALREICVAGDETWVVGDGGQVWHRDANARWESIDCPTTSDLRGVCVRDASLYVCGEGGTFLRSAEGLWYDEGAGRWSDQDLLSVVAAEEAPIALCTADSLFFRDGDSWTPQEIDYASTSFRRLKSFGTRVWIESNNSVSCIEPGSVTWQVLPYYVHWEGSHVAPGEGQSALVVAENGLMRWYASPSESTDDPVGLPANYSRLFALDDGTMGCTGQAGILIVEPSGLVVQEGFSDEVLSLVRRGSDLIGASLDDFYVADYSSFCRILDREQVQRIELPPSNRKQSMALDGEGRLYVCSGQSVYRCDGEMPEQVLSVGTGTYPHFYLSGLSSGRVAAWTSNETWVLDDEWVEIRIDGVTGAYELSGGEFAFFEPGQTPEFPDLIHFWRAGLQSPRQMLVDLKPGLAGLQINRMYVKNGTLYAATGAPVRFFRLDDDPLADRWHQVAGPYSNHIGEFLVLDDGSLLVFDRVNYHISIHRSR